MTVPAGIDLTRVRCRIIESLGVPLDAPWFVAYSGGLDSTVLLHVLARIAGDSGTRLVALHADHGLSARSSQWREHCRRQCEAWGVDCRTTRLVYESASGLGPEGRARDARYRWLREATGGEGWLFTAHHRGDQAETVIERLARGAGPRGLCGMQPAGRVYGMNIARPLLDTPREAIRAYAEREALRWVSDESNTDTALTRNYIRHEVLPGLTQRWPGIEAALARTARTLSDARVILDEAAGTDLARANRREQRGESSLDIAPLQAMPRERRRNLLHCWIREESGASLSFRRLYRLEAAIDAYPRLYGGLRWPPVELRAHGGRLYLLKPWPQEDGSTHWHPDRELALDSGIVLRPKPAVGEGLKKSALVGGVTVTFRRGGERCRLPGRRHHHTLKQVFQEAAVPPWQRGRIPLVCIDGEIAAIAGLTVCEPYIAGTGEEGVVIEPRYPRR